MYMPGITNVESHSDALAQWTGLADQRPDHARREHVVGQAETGRHGSKPRMPAPDAVTHNAESRGCGFGNVQGDLPSVSVRLHVHAQNQVRDCSCSWVDMISQGTIETSWSRSWVLVCPFEKIKGIPIAQRDARCTMREAQNMMPWAG